MTKILNMIATYDSCLSKAKAQVFILIFYYQGVSLYKAAKTLVLVIYSTLGSFNHVHCLSLTSLIKYFHLNFTKPKPQRQQIREQLDR